MTYITTTSHHSVNPLVLNSTSQNNITQQQNNNIRPVLTPTGVIPSLHNVLMPVFEYMCAEIQLRFYYKHGDYVTIEELIRILSKCSSTPDVLLRKLLENGVIKPGDRPDVVQVV
mgnify:CR=1 FL=1